MNNAEPILDPRPSAMPEGDFVARFGHVYEHSPWVAQRAWHAGLDADADTPAGLAARLATQVDAAGAEEQLALIRAHPDLGGRAARTGSLTTDSAREQAGAGLDACTPEEFERLQQLNDAYTARFGFPFVIAVRGLSRADILAAMANRLDNDADQERQTALAQIHKIARLRLAAMAQP